MNNNISYLKSDKKSQKKFYFFEENLESCWVQDYNVYRLVFIIFFNNELDKDRIKEVDRTYT